MLCVWIRQVSIPSLLYKLLSPEIDLSESEYSSSNKKRELSISEDRSLAFWARLMTEGGKLICSGAIRGVYKGLIIKIYEFTLELVSWVRV